MTNAEIKRRIYVALGGILAAMLLGGFNAWYTNHVAEIGERERQRSSCDILRAQHDVYVESPPSTETGRRLAREIDRLHERYGC